MCCFWLLPKIPNLQCINHKYLMIGYTHMEVDGVLVHSIIERKKRQPQFSFHHFILQQFIRSFSSNKSQIEVIDTVTDDF